MLTNNPTAMITMASNLLTAGDKTKALAARDIPTLVLYGEDDNAWPPTLQAEMSTRLGAQQFCIPERSTQPERRSPGNHSPRPDAVSGLLRKRMAQRCKAALFGPP